MCFKFTLSLFLSIILLINTESVHFINGYIFFYKVRKAMLI